MHYFFSFVCMPSSNILKMVPRKGLQTFIKLVGHIGISIFLHFIWLHSFSLKGPNNELQLSLGLLFSQLCCKWTFKFFKSLNLSPASSHLVSLLSGFSSTLQSECKFPCISHHVTICVTCDLFQVESPMSPVSQLPCTAWPPIIPLKHADGSNASFVLAETT